MLRRRSHERKRQPMIPGTVFGLLPLMLGLLVGDASIVRESVARLNLQEEVILRVPVEPRSLMPRIEWIERKGPKCVPVENIRSAILSGEQQVDFVLSNHGRFRAKLNEDCPALDFYRGFYLQPQDDRLCAGRDELHDRTGGSCRIDRFRQLVPKAR